MTPMWGSKQWQLCSAIVIILVLGYGTYTILSDILAGHPIWWYNASFVLFGITILGLLLLVRQGWTTLQNIVKYGPRPSSTASDETGVSDYQNMAEADIDQEDPYFRGDNE